MFWGTSLVVRGNLLALGTLSLIILLSAGMVLATIVLPARFSVRQVDRRLVCWGTAYFLLIGLGFMLVEIGLVQRISVFIGHPTYALSIVLFGIILSTGLGSFVSEKAAPNKPVHFVLWIGTLAAYLITLPLWLPELTHSSLETKGLLTRALVSIAVTAPAGLLMGFGFPTGMRLVMAADRRPAPWFWGVNGAAGVLAAGIAVACSIAFSIDTTIQTGGVCYVLLAPAALLLLRTSGPGVSRT